MAKGTWWGVWPGETERLGCISYVTLGDFKRHHFTLYEKERRMINTVFVFGKTIGLRNIVHTF